MLDNTVGNFNTTITTAVSLEKENTAENDENFSSMQVDQPCLFSDLAVTDVILNCDESIWYGGFSLGCEID